MRDQTVVIYKKIFEKPERLGFMAEKYNSEQKN